jgi:hypothetical protein
MFSEQYRDFGEVYDLGHGLHGHNPDWTWERPELAMAMAESTHRQLVALCQTYKTDCEPQDFASFRDTVDQFVRYEPDVYRSLGNAWVPTVGDYRLKLRHLDPQYEITEEEFEKYVRPYIRRRQNRGMSRETKDSFWRLLTDPSAWRQLMGGP